ncbi:rRNA maturation RNase YbeY [Bacillus carboniphilus]|uniref:Endoribonuclease YbeY n=1 Tax=Bacillus carboniphilus TaxID=86663 RepID=A0ABY9JZJ1_9BACI|nr:rRNA maturation RNase YbeY [Bacillus carboniphilus]WLR43982.1 rRNA maturation RNase YbeY [Bacillus carboniphilus]
MNLQVDLNDELNVLTEIQKEKIEKLLQNTAEIEEIEKGAEVSVTFVNNESIRQINREYRDKDQETDVISFALEEHAEDEINIKGEHLPRVLGDIIVSYPKAVEQAEQYGHSLMREILFLTVHGFLHLLGYDHMTEEDEKEMFNKQKEILDRYGYKREGEI